MGLGDFLTRTQISPIQTTHGYYVTQVSPLNGFTAYQFELLNNSLSCYNCA